MPLISDDFNFNQDGLKTPTRLSSVNDSCLSFGLYSNTATHPCQALPAEGNIACLSIRYVSLFNIYHTAVPRDGISFIGYRKRGQVRRL
jgi:hypothetical protein